MIDNHFCKFLANNLNDDSKSKIDPKTPRVLKIVKVYQPLPIENISALKEEIEKFKTSEPPKFSDINDDDSLRTPVSLDSIRTPVSEDSSPNREPLDNSKKFTTYPLIDDSLVFFKKAQNLQEDILKPRSRPIAIGNDRIINPMVYQFRSLATDNLSAEIKPQTKDHYSLRDRQRDINKVSSQLDNKKPEAFETPSIKCSCKLIKSIKKLLKNLEEKVLFKA